MPTDCNETLAPTTSCPTPHPTLHTEASGHQASIEHEGPLTRAPGACPCHCQQAHRDGLISLPPCQPPPSPSAEPGQAPGKVPSSSLGPLRPKGRSRGETGRPSRGREPPAPVRQARGWRGRRGERSSLLPSLRGDGRRRERGCAAPLTRRAGQRPLREEEGGGARARPAPPPFQVLRGTRAAAGSGRGGSRCGGHRAGPAADLTLPPPTPPRSPTCPRAVPGSDYATVARRGVGRERPRREGVAPRRTFKLPAAAGLRFPACRGAAACSLAQARCGYWAAVTGAAAVLSSDLTEASLSLPRLTLAARRPGPRSFCLRICLASASGRPPRPRLLKEGPSRLPRCFSAPFPASAATARLTRRFIDAGAAFVRLRAFG